MQSACLDMSCFDGRIYASTLPDYVTRHELLSLLPHSTEEVQVFVGLDGQPLQSEEPVHLFPGVLITYLPVTDDPPLPYTMGQLLMMRDAWCSEYSLPESTVGEAYCLVCCGRARLHLADAEVPVRHRDHIAAATAIPVQYMRLYAASSPPADVSEHGVPCRTVIAAYDSRRAPDTVWHGIILDCRHILEDWQELYVSNGRLDVRQLLHRFQMSTPSGWQPRINVDVDDTGIATVRPGQVVTVTYASTDQAAPSSVHPQPEPASESSSSNPGRR